MIANAIAGVAGLIFALGLGIGGMTQPAKIVGFLDVAGRWDPSLVFVLAGAVGTYMLIYRWIHRQRHPVYAPRFQIPTVRSIDRRLVLGAAVFGVGWGIGGFCPGPAITALVSLHPVAITFVLAMLAGMAVFDFTPFGALSSRRPVARPAAADAAEAPTVARPATTDG